MKLEPQLWPIPQQCWPRLVAECELSLPQLSAGMLPLFKATHDDKTFYCAQCGGEMRNAPDKPKSMEEWKIADNDVLLTPHGEAAAVSVIEWVQSIPIEPACVVMVQLVKGETPTLDKMRNAFNQAPHNAIVCFIGDFANTLDGEISSLILQSVKEGEI